MGDHYASNADPGGQSKAAFMGSIFMVPGILLTPVFPNPNVALVGLALIPFGMAFITVNIVTAMLRVTPNQLRGQVYAVLLMVMTLAGTTFGPTLVAIITDYVFRNEMMIGYSMFIVGLGTGFFSNIAFYQCMRTFRALEL